MSTKREGMRTSTKLILAHVALSALLIALIAMLAPRILRGAGAAAAEIQNSYEATRADGGTRP